MAGSYNRVTLVGNLGSEPEQRFLPNGDPVTTFSVATTEKRRDEELTTWWRVSAWGKLAETCAQFLHKGSYVLIEGPVTNRPYTDKDGNQRTSLEVNAREMRMLDRKSERDDQSGRGGGYSGPANTPPMDEIPF